MNSIMDNRKVLSFPNNDCIYSKPIMRMFFKIRDFKLASKATVSPANILYITNDEGYQWRDNYKSWVNESNEFKKKNKDILIYLETFL